MAMTSAEKQRRYRERQKKLLEKAPDVTLEFLRRPFSEFLEERSTEFEENLDFIGVDIRGSLHNEVQSFQTMGTIEEPFKGNALDRMEVLAEIMLATAQEFYQLVHDYKVAEIDARIAEIEGADFTDPAARKQAFADVVRLNQIRSRLGQDFRRSFREINVKETPSD